MSVPPFTRVLHSWAGVSRSVAEVNRGGTNGRHEDGERWTDTEQRKHMVVSIGWPLSSPPFPLIVYHSCRSLTSRSLHFHFVRRWRGGGKWKKWTTEAPTEARRSGGEGRRSLNPRSVPPLVFRSLSLHIQDSFKSWDWWCTKGKGKVNRFHVRRLFPSFMWLIPVSRSEVKEGRRNGRKWGRVWTRREERDEMWTDDTKKRREQWDTPLVTHVTHARTLIPRLLCSSSVPYGLFLLSLRPEERGTEGSEWRVGVMRKVIRRDRIWRDNGNNQEIARFFHSHLILSVRLSFAHPSRLIPFRLRCRSFVSHAVPSGVAKRGLRRDGIESERTVRHT